MSDKTSKVDVMERNLKELEIRTKELEQNVNEKTDQNEVLVHVDEEIKKQQLVTRAELETIEEKLEASLHKSQMKLLKWMIATGISSVSAVIALLQIFMI